MLNWKLRIHFNAHTYAIGFYILLARDSMASRINFGFHFVQNSISCMQFRRSGKKSVADPMLLSHVSPAGMPCRQPR